MQNLPSRVHVKHEYGASVSFSEGNVPSGELLPTLFAVLTSRPEAEGHWWLAAWNGHEFEVTSAFLQRLSDTRVRIRTDYSDHATEAAMLIYCLLYTSPSPRDS